MLLPEKNVVLPAGAPVLKYGTEWNPAKVYLDARTDQETEAYLPTLENQRQKLSDILKSAFTTASMSQGQEIILLRALSEVQDRGLATFHTTLAKKSCTLTKWAAQGHEKCFASNARTFRIDSAGFLQGQSTAEFKTLNALDLIQTVLLKPELKDYLTLTDGIDQFFDEAKEEKCIGGEGWF